MAYKKKSSSKKKTLKKSNIYGKTNAKSQAKQIYALNKKVNKIQKLTAPEINTWHGNIITYRTQYGQGPDNDQVHIQRNLIFRGSIFQQGRSMSGDLFRTRKLTLYGCFAQYAPPTLENDWVTNTNYRLAVQAPKTAYLRIVICRLNKAGAIAPENIFSDSPAEVGGSGNDLTTIFGPLQNGITTSMTVIKDKVLKLSPTKDAKGYKIGLHPGVIRKNTFENSVSGEHNYENEIVVYTAYAAPTMLTYVSNQGAVYKVGPTCFFTMNYKLAYTEDP